MDVRGGSGTSWYPLPPGWRTHAASTDGAVLLETAGGLGVDHYSYLFTAPNRILEASTREELIALLEEVERERARGAYAAGYLEFEAGYVLHALEAPCPGRPLARFGLYARPLRFDHHNGEVQGTKEDLGATSSAIGGTSLLSRPVMRQALEGYAHKFEAVQRLLEAGDTYQVNLTTALDAEVHATPDVLYEALLSEQPVDYSAIVHLGGPSVLSFSPELFFRIDGEKRRISTRPMKGTAPRGATSEADTAQREWLRADPKNHAEHVMIVDLLRNDLGRVCLPGTVETAKLFEIEAYPTLFQMTSEVTGLLPESVGILELMRALFPSGSVTGAPKRRTLEIIRDIEDHTRGIYTGAIGFLAPSGDACFSVAIRTLVVDGGHVCMGVGGGIVADSEVADEYRECALKASFLSAAVAEPQLIETLRWEKRFVHLQEHLDRLSRSASELGFSFDRESIFDRLHEASQTFEDAVLRIRLLLAPDGRVTVEAQKLTGKLGDLHVRVAAQRTSSGDAWLRHKTTRRQFYDREWKRAQADGFDEVLFLNQRDELTESANGNLFLELEGRLWTPPLGAGVLPGVGRELILRAGGAEERTLRMEDLRSARVGYLVNSLRGLRSIASITIE